MALARAAYSDKSLFLLDDPLSAVDAHVGKHIVDNLLGPKGMLRRKTRVLVTHSHSLLPIADQILFLENGKVKEEGTYKELSCNPKSALSLMISGKEVEAGKDKGKVGAGGGRGGRAEVREREGEAAEVRENKIQFALEVPVNQGRRTSGNNNNDNKLDKEDERKKQAVGANLMEEEATNRGSLMADVVLLWAKLMTWKYITFGPILMVLYYATEIGASFWLSHWTNPYRAGRFDQSASNTSSTMSSGSFNDFLFYVGIYALFAVFNGIFNMASALFLLIGGVIAGEQIHEKLCKRIMKAPMTFFDTTPIGRITNRYIC